MPTQEERITDLEKQSFRTEERFVNLKESLDRQEKSLESIIDEMRSIRQAIIPSKISLIIITGIVSFVSAVIVTIFSYLINNAAKGH
mgnify:FL=1